MLTDLTPGEPEPRGLLALLLLTHARRDSRLDAQGLVLFEDQDRSRWDRELLVEGLNLATDLLDDPADPGQYRLLATIAANHAASIASGSGSVDWPAILRLYDVLMSSAPTPVVALNRAIALAHVEGEAAALAEVDQLDLDSYHPFHIVRAHLLEQLGRRDEARDAIATALTYVTKPLERTHLENRLQGLAD